MNIDTRGQETRTKLQLSIVSVFQPCRKKKNEETPSTDAHVCLIRGEK